MAFLLENDIIKKDNLVKVWKKKLDKYLEDDSRIQCFDKEVYVSFTLLEGLRAKPCH